MIRSSLFSAVFFLFVAPLVAAEDESTSSEKIKSIVEEGIIVDLKNPQLRDGVLTTEEGGVIKGKNIRIQAKKIQYTQKTGEDGQRIQTVVAEENLMVELNDRTFIADRVEYDLVAETGILINGHTGMPPWYLAGEKVELRSDGSFYIADASMSTCENVESEWDFRAKKVSVKNNRILSARGLQLRFFKLPVFWTPSFKTSAKNMFDAPVHYRIKWGGGQGPRLTMDYRLYNGDYWNAIARADYSIKRGAGIGVSGGYRDARNDFDSFTSNYVAWDRKDNRRRYRFEGWASQDFDKTHAVLHYDRLSDADMTSDYFDRDYDIAVPSRTQLIVWHQEKNWIADATSRLRINHFQTIKQELPTVEWSNKPMQLGYSGLFIQNRVAASYLDLEYANGLSTVFKDLTSTRVRAETEVYYPITFERYAFFTPSAGLSTNVYGNSYDGSSEAFLSTHAGAEVKGRFVRYFKNRHRHVAEPYAKYDFFGRPSSTPEEHYVFDTFDGITGLQTVRFGLRNELSKKSDETVERKLYADVYSFAFINPATFVDSIPHVYTDVIFPATQKSRYFLTTAYNFSQSDADLFAVRGEWTFSQHMAASLEYRKRGKYYWKKAERFNFFLEGYRSETSLLASDLTDENQLLTPKLSWRFAPNWTAHSQLRYGFGRPSSPDFLEYRVEVQTLIRCAWAVKLHYQRREDDKFNFGINLLLDDKKPMKKPIRDLSW